MPKSKRTTPETMAEMWEEYRDTAGLDDRRVYSETETIDARRAYYAGATRMMTELFRAADRNDLEEVHKKLIEEIDRFADLIGTESELAGL